MPADDLLHVQIADWLVAANNRIATPASTLPAVRHDRVREAVRASHPRLRRCYERGLTRDPKLAGSVLFRITIVGTRPTQVEVGSSSLSDRAVETCIASELQKLTFPRARDAGKLDVRYPFVFKPDE